LTFPKLSSNPTSAFLSAVAEGWQVQPEAWMVQHTSIREAVHELKSQTAILAEILELLRYRIR
jgi:hypothetical protein